MIPEIDSYFEKIRYAIFLAENNYSYDEMNRQFGSELTNESIISAYVKAFKEELLKWNAPNAPQPKIIVGMVLQDIEKIIEEFKPLMAVIEFREPNLFLTIYDYMERVNDNFIAFIKGIRETVEEFKLKIPNSNIIEYVEKERQEPLSFPGFIMNHSKPEALTEALKNEFKGCKPRIIRFMVEALKKESKLKFGSDNSLHKALYEYFEGGIGTYSAIFEKYKFDEKPKEIDGKKIEGKRIKEIKKIFYPLHARVIEIINQTEL
jgi:hypothetical protein